MTLVIILVLIILVEGLLISISLIKLKDNYLKDFYGKFELEDSRDIQFYILIAAFNEGSIIKDTYEHFQKIMCKYDNIECFFITTEKENAVFGKNLTKEILEENISDDKLAQDLAYMALGTGLLEVNSRGAGFTNYRWL